MSADDKKAPSRIEVTAYMREPGDGKTKQFKLTWEFDNLDGIRQWAVECLCNELRDWARSLGKN